MMFDLEVSSTFLQNCLWLMTDVVQTFKIDSLVNTTKTFYFALMNLAIL